MPVSADLCNNFKSVILKTDQRKIYPSWVSFWRSSKNIYSPLSIILHITPWTLILMLRIRQSIYLVLANVLSASFLIVHITFHEISLQFQSTNISLLHMYLSTSIFTRIVQTVLPELDRLYSLYNSGKDRCTQIHVEQWYVCILESYLC